MGLRGLIIILASCEHHFMRVHENLVQHTSNNISIITLDRSIKRSISDILRVMGSNLGLSPFFNQSPLWSKVSNDIMLDE